MVLRTLDCFEVIIVWSFLNGLFELVRRSDVSNGRQTKSKKRENMFGLATKLGQRRTKTGEEKQKTNTNSSFVYFSQLVWNTILSNITS